MMISFPHCILSPVILRLCLSLHDEQPTTWKIMKPLCMQIINRKYFLLANKQKRRRNHDQVIPNSTIISRWTHFDNISCYFSVFGGVEKPVDTKTEHAHIYSPFMISLISSCAQFVNPPRGTGRIISNRNSWPGKSACEMFRRISMKSLLVDEANCPSVVQKLSPDQTKHILSRNCQRQIKSRSGIKKGEK